MDQRLFPGRRFAQGTVTAAALQLLDKRMHALLEQVRSFLRLRRTSAFLGQLFVSQRQRDVIGDPRREDDVVLTIGKRPDRIRTRWRRSVDP